VLVSLIAAMILAPPAVVLLLAYLAVALIYVSPRYSPKAVLAAVSVPFGVSAEAVGARPTRWDRKKHAGDVLSSGDAALC
jgi:hypothetical protein